MSETVDVVVDNREPPEMLTAMDQHDDVNDWRLDQLDIGDIRFGHAGVVIERKTPEDYASSVLSGRLDSQLHRMADAQDRPYVLVEGSISDFDSLEHTRIRSQSLRGHVASTMARRRVPVLFCDEMNLLVDLGVRLARKEIEDKSVSYLQPSVVNDASLPLTMQVYTCIPGIGVKTAESLYDHYPSVSDLLAASVEDLKEVSGVGAKTATEIHGSLRA